MSILARSLATFTAQLYNNLVRRALSFSLLQASIMHINMMKTMTRLPIRLTVFSQSVRFTTYVDDVANWGPEGQDCES